MNKSDSDSKTTKPVSPDHKLEEEALLESWHPHIKNAMHNLYGMFRSSNKFILTESDLKCWLFYFLQQEKPYIPYAVHSEVTHYANHKDNDKDSNKKYKFRDLSLLCPWEIKANEELLKDGANKKDLLFKGFLHRAPAIHFELKFLRHFGNIHPLLQDFSKLSDYHPDIRTSPRHFIIVCGSSFNLQTADKQNEILSSFGKINELNTLSVKCQLFLFDTSIMIHKNNQNEITDYAT